MKLEFRVEKLEKKVENHEKRLTILEKNIVPYLKDIKSSVEKYKPQTYQKIIAVLLILFALAI